MKLSQLARLFTALTISAFVVACGDDIKIDDHRRGEAEKQMIAVAHPLAAQAGLEILRNGGSAVDAAIAAEMVLTLVEPQSSGIGGGAFLVHFDASQGALETFDGRETAPASLTPSIFLDDTGNPMPWPKAAFGGRAVGVPGLMRMLALAHAKHGLMPWRDLFIPAIQLAEQGFSVTPRLARSLKRDDEMPTVPSTAAYFYPGGYALKAGDILKNPALARVLRTVAGQGPDAFYSGEIAQGIVDAIAAVPIEPSVMTLDDIASYQAKARAPVCGEYRKHKVCGMGPPSSGGILVAQILGMLDHFDLPSMQPFSADAVHLIAEASRLAFADRALYVGDSDFVDVPVDGLLDRAYLRERARLINLDKRMPKAHAGKAGPASGRFAPAEAAQKGLSTTHMAVRDRFGNIVSMTATIERAFGAKFMSQGFLLNNEMTDFSFRPTVDGKPVANAPAPGKRPRSTMSPTMVFDPAGKAVLAIGSPGGSRIAGYTLKAILGVLAWDMHIADAIAAPNIVNRSGPLEIEKGTDAVRLKSALEALGHEVKVRPMTSGLHGIHIFDNRLEGGADPRREGVVLGD